ncbi:GIY-YIG nuclease superfamily, partial [Tuber brumale]
KKKSSIGSVVQSNNSVIAKLPKYNNVDIEKLQILQDNVKKSGIYLFKNLINGKRYVGSSDNLSRRFRRYFNVNYLEKKTCMLICLALLKYGYSNFSVEILEYCEPSHNIEREKYYITLLSPQYNIVQDPTKNPMYGRKHSPSAIKKISEAQQGEKNNMFGRTGENCPRFGKEKPFGSGKPSQQIEVFDKEKNLTTTYDSISAAARALSVFQQSISKYLKSDQTEKPYKGRYIIKKV